MLEIIFVRKKNWSVLEIFILAHFLHEIIPAPEEEKEEEEEEAFTVIYRLFYTFLIIKFKLHT